MLHLLPAFLPLLSTFSVSSSVSSVTLWLVFGLARRDGAVRVPRQEGQGSAPDRPANPCKDAERMTHSVPRPTGPRWLYPALFLFLAALAVPYGHKALDHRSAFVRWQSQVVQLQDGVDIAEGYNY